MSEEKANVEEFVRYLISLGGIYNVDKDGYVEDKVNPEDPVILKSGTQVKRLMVIKDVITDTDALIINPLNENAMESIDAKWLYSMLNVGLVRRFIEVVNVLKLILETEKANNETKNKDDLIELSHDMIEFASRHKDFDMKTFENFKIISKDKLNFMSVWYNRKMKKSTLRCSIYDPDIISEFPHISKKFWKQITGLFSEILGLSSDIEKSSVEIRNKYSVTSDLITVPRLESMLMIYLKIYQKLNPYLDMCEMEDEDFVVDLTTFSHHIEKLPDYYNRAKWFTTATSIPQTNKTGLQDARIIGTGSNIPPNPAIAPPISGIYQQESNIPPNPLRRSNQHAPLYSQQPQTTFFNAAPSIPLINTQPMFNTGLGFNTGIIQTNPSPSGFQRNSNLDPRLYEGGGFPRSF